MRKTAASILLAASLTIATPVVAHAERSPWRPVPHAIRAQFRADGTPLHGRCRIRYGDTTVIQCVLRGTIKRYYS